MSVEFLLTSLVVVLIPGTGVVYTVSSSIGGGWRRGLFAAIGCTLSIVPHMLAAMLGLSGIMQAGSAVFEAVRWAGVPTSSSWACR
jgi:threonine/homoserine/homoserine lactone efflux protein